MNRLLHQLIIWAVIILRNQNRSFCLWVWILSIIYQQLSFGIIIIVHNYIFSWTAHHFYCYFIYKVVIFYSAPLYHVLKFDWFDIKIDSVIIECSVDVFLFIFLWYIGIITVRIVASCNIGHFRNELNFIFTSLVSRSLIISCI